MDLAPVARAASARLESSAVADTRSAVWKPTTIAGAPAPRHNTSTRATTRATVGASVAGYAPGRTTARPSPLPVAIATGTATADVHKAYCCARATQRNGKLACQDARDAHGSHQFRSVERFRVSRRRHHRGELGKVWVSTHSAPLLLTAPMCPWCRNEHREQSSLVGSTNGKREVRSAVGIRADLKNIVALAFVPSQLWHR